MTKKSAPRGHTIFDLDALFSQDFAKNGEHFEFPTDSHWNACGHQVLADAMTDLFGQL